MSEVERRATFPGQPTAHAQNHARGPVTRRELFRTAGGLALSASVLPLLVLIGHADTVTPAHYCEQMKAGQPASAPELTLVVYPRGPHTFDVRLRDRTLLGMRLGYDADATADARRRVVAFLIAQGLITGRGAP